ncbi:hypothetical protein [Streptomyces virginiae]|uniref:hypothetical protein n=1 Tax=Streptomyces virginiae TaxID=1961 RepID=UPI002F916D61|nr:hypothetical protein OG253_42375 [Streptomyces virginiae]
MAQADIAQRVSTRVILLGPYSRYSPLLPGHHIVRSHRILETIDGYSQILQALTVTVAAPKERPGEEVLVGAMSVTDLHVITMPDGVIGVNFIITNVHATNPVAYFDYWIAMRVRE